MRRTSALSGSSLTSKGPYRTVLHAVAFCFLMSPLATSEAFAATAQERGISVPSISYRGDGRPLQVPNQAGVPATVADFLAKKGRAPVTINSLRVKSEIPVPDRRKIVVFDQEVDGLTVYGSRLKAILDENGNLLSLRGNMVEVNSGVLMPQIEARGALIRAMAFVHPNVSVNLVEIGGVDNTTTFGSDPYFHRDPTVTSVAVPMPGAALEEGFLVEIWTEEQNQLHHVLIDGNGRVLEVQNRTANDSYYIFEESPDVGTQTLKSGPAPVTAAGETPSPDGWIDDTAAQYDIDIQGNNANAYLDQDNNNGPDAGGIGVSDLNFDAMVDLTVDPYNSENPAVAVQNLFYLNNLIHDELYRHGFDEAAGNFQENNFGRGGSGSDSVNAEAQDGGGTNNANFATPSDGSNPRMQMYLWNTNGSNPRRDGSLDGDIVWHEYGHGLTWRMIGNMTGVMGGALGEGWSDTLAIIQYDDDAVAEYSHNHSVGIRSQRYGDFDPNVRNYESITGSSVHSDGEILGAITWDMWTRYGNDGFTRDDIMSDFVQGMNYVDYQCSRPTFPTVRDGILEAISGSSDPLAAPSDPSKLARWCHTWEAFARFGVGVDQTTTCQQRGWGPFTNISWEWFNGFSTPTECPVGPTVQNDPPFVVQPIDNQTTDEDSPFSLDVSANFSDPDGQPQSLTYSVTGVNWLNVNASTGVLSGTPRNDDVGIATVTVTANDGQDSVSDIFAMTVNNTNDAPILTSPIADQVTTVDVLFTLDVSGNFNDVDVGDTLTFTGTHPSWLTLNADTGVFSGTPTSDDIADDIPVTVTASDGQASESDIFNITVSSGSSGTPDACDGLADGIHFTTLATSQGRTWTATVDAVKCSGGDEVSFDGTSFWSPDLGGSDCAFSSVGVCKATQSGIRKKVGSVQVMIDGSMATILKP